MKKFTAFLGAVAIIALIAVLLMLILSPFTKPKAEVGEVVVSVPNHQEVLVGNEIEELKRKETLKSFDKLVPEEMAAKATFYPLDEMTISFNGKNEPMEFRYEMFSEEDFAKSLGVSPIFKKPEENGKYLVRVVAKWGYEDEFNTYEYFFGIEVR